MHLERSGLESSCHASTASDTSPFLMHLETCMLMMTALAQVLPMIEGMASLYHVHSIVQMCITSMTDVRCICTRWIWRAAVMPCCILDFSLCDAPGNTFMHMLTVICTGHDRRGGWAAASCTKLLLMCVTSMIDLRCIWRQDFEGATVMPHCTPNSSFRDAL